MKNILIRIAHSRITRLCLAVLIVFSISAITVDAAAGDSAKTFLSDTAASTDFADDSGEDLNVKIASFIQTFLGFTSVILLVVIIYAGFLWMTAGGNPEQVKKGQAWLKNGVIGIAIIMLAYIITWFIIDAII